MAKLSYFLKFTEVFYWVILDKPLLTKPARREEDRKTGICTNGTIR